MNQVALVGEAYEVFTHTRWRELAESIIEDEHQCETAQKSKACQSFVPTLSALGYQFVNNHIERSDTADLLSIRCTTAVDARLRQAIGRLHRE